MGGTQALVKWGPHLMDQEVGEIFWLQFDILEKDRTSWMMILLKYQIEGYLKIVENFLCQLLFLSVGAKGLGLENESSTWNLSSSDKRRWQNTIRNQVACQQILLQLLRAMYYPTYEAQVTWSQLGINSSEYSFQAFVAEVQVDPLISNDVSYYKERPILVVSTFVVLKHKMVSNSGVTVSEYER